MGKIKLYADSTCDLSEKLIEKYKVSIIPLYITMGDRTGKDGTEIKPEDIYLWANENNTTPKTAAFSPEDAMQEINVCKESGDDMIFFCISEDMSSSGNVIRLAAEDMEYSEHVFVINSMNLSTGIGLQIERTAHYIEEGLNITEIIQKIDDIKPRVRASFVVDTLTYLYRGGRCSGTVALIGNTLKLKPKIVVKDGKMDVDTKYRGKQESVVMKYVKDLEPLLRNAEEELVFITHSGINPKVVKSVEEYLLSLHIFKNIEETRAGGVVSSHCGPGTLGVLFIEK